MVLRLPFDKLKQINGEWKFFQLDLSFFFLEHTLWRRIRAFLFFIFRDYPIPNEWMNELDFVTYLESQAEKVGHYSEFGVSCALATTGLRVNEFGCFSFLLMFFCSYFSGNKLWMMKYRAKRSLSLTLMMMNHSFWISDC